MSRSNVSVGDIAFAAKKAMEENDINKQDIVQFKVAETCKKFIIQREKEWKREAEKYTMRKLCVLYNLLPRTSNVAENTLDADGVENTLDADVVENTQDAYIEPRKILLRRMQQQVDKMRQSERWNRNSPKDHYFILNVEIGEV